MDVSVSAVGTLLNLGHKMVTNFRGLLEKGSDVPIQPTPVPRYVWGLSGTSQDRLKQRSYNFGTECRGFESLRARHHFHAMPS